MKVKESTYIAIRRVFEKWYGLTNDHANLMAQVEILELVEKDINEQLANPVQEG